MKKFLLFLLFSLCYYHSYAQQCDVPLKIVVLGSSTAWGNGVPSRDSAWTFRYLRYLKANHRTDDTVIILAKGGNTTHTIQATGTPAYTVSGVTFTVDTTCNISKALSLNPSAIIINIPNEDEARNFPLAVQVANLLAIKQQAASQNVPLWVATTQPRNNLGYASGARLLQMKDSIISYFGTKAIDFMTGLADNRGYILPAYNSGDDALFNSSGQQVLFEKVVAKQLPQALCGNPTPGFQLSAFTSSVSSQKIWLNWSTISEVSTLRFGIERSTDSLNWTNIGYVNGAGSSNASRNYTFTDSTITFNQLYYYRLNHETTSGLHTISQVITGKVVTGAGNCSKALKVVVLGSSTAWGNGLPDRDSAWTLRYARYLKQYHNSADTLILKAIGSSTTQNMLPTGTPAYTVPATGLTYNVDTLNNITKAISFQPDFIIINMPSNDEARSFPLSKQVENFRVLKQVAANNNIPLWVTTSQPRSNLGYASAQRLMQLKDSINLIFGDKAIDFWTGLGYPNGYIDSLYNSGDDVHFNAAGQRILFERVVAKNIPSVLCGSTARHASPVEAAPTFKPLVAGFSNTPASTIKIYPNPATSYVNIPAFCQEPFLLEVYNSTGTRLLQDKRSGSVQLQIGSWPAGIYYLILTHGGTRERLKFIKIGFTQRR